MGKIIRTLLILFLLYYIYEFAFVYFDSGHSVTYNIKSGDYIFDITENAYTNLKIEDDNYSFNIKVNNSEFKYTLFVDFKKYSYVIKEVNYFKDTEHECIFVKYIDNKVINDVLCKKHNNMIYYNSIEKPSEGLVKFVNSLDGYDVNKFKDVSGYKTYNGINIYEDNQLPNHFVGLSYGNGFFRINNLDKITNVKIYDTDLDISKIKVASFVDSKYITFNYAVMNNYLQAEFRSINDRSYDEKNIEGVTISMDAYSLGTHGTSLYIYDPVSKKEYEMDYKTQNILEVGNAQTGILYYENGKKKRVSLDKIDSINFENTYPSDYTSDDYAKIDKTGIKHGYYYMYKKNGNEYDIYRSDINNRNISLYIGKTTNKDKVFYSDDYIYYVDGTTLKYFSDSTGTKKVMANNSMLLSDYSKLYVYIKN